MEQTIFTINPWWKTRHVDKARLGTIPREQFEPITASLTSNNKITCIYGPRRAGKTTLLYESINYLIKIKKNDPHRILFLTFDSYKLTSLDFDTIINDFCLQLNEPTDKLTGPIYIFCDEIHKLENWSNKLKFWHDNNQNIKFIVSGSSSHNIIKGAGESLLGRISFYLILPLSLKELLFHLLNFNLTNYEIAIHDFKNLNMQYTKFQKYHQEISIIIRRYMNYGGFPEIQSIKEQETIYEILRNYKYLTLNRDILEIYAIKEPKTLSDLFDLTTDFMSNRINFNHFANILKIKIDTVKQYLSYFEQVFMLYTSSVYSRSHVINTRKEKKLHFFDVGIRNACLLKDIDQHQYEIIAENMVFTHLYRLKAKEHSPKIFYYQDKQKNEVDFVVTGTKGDIPIEVKFGNLSQSFKHKGLKSINERYQFKNNVIITSNNLKKDKNIISLPLWLFLLTSKL